MNIFSLRLVHKITGIGIIGLAGVLLTGGIHWYGEAATAVHRDASENARSIFDLNRKIEIEMLESRRAEKDFLLRGDLKKADRQVQIGKSVAADIDALRGKFSRPVSLI